MKIIEMLLNQIKKLNKNYSRFMIKIYNKKINFLRYDYIYD